MPSSRKPRPVRKVWSAWSWAASRTTGGRQVAGRLSVGLAPTGSEGEDELAPQVAGVQQAMGVGDALERERLLHVDPEPALLDELDETAQADRIGVDRDAAEAQAGRLVAGDEVLVLLGDRGHQVATGAQHLERALDGVAADRVEHDVDVTDRLGEVDRRVVDDLVGAEPLDELPLASARGRDHVRAERLRD